MGPALGFLVLAILGKGRVTVKGDSKYVIGLLNKQYLPTEVYLFNCIQLALDVG